MLYYFNEYLLYSLSIAISRVFEVEKNKWKIIDFLKMLTNKIDTTSKTAKPGLGHRLAWKATFYCFCRLFLHQFSILKLWPMALVLEWKIYIIIICFHSILYFLFYFYKCMESVRKWSNLGIWLKRGEGGMNKCIGDFDYFRIWQVSYKLPLLFKFVQLFQACLSVNKFWLNIMN